MKTQDFWFGYCPACFKPTERRVDYQAGRCDISYHPDCPTKAACEKRILGPVLAGTPRAIDVGTTPAAGASSPLR
jgi:hypothetical protein